MDDWRLREDHLDLSLLPRAAALFALSNGHLGVRGDLDEAAPGPPPTTLLNSVHEERPMSYPEPGYGYAQTEQRLVPVASGAVIGLEVDGEPLDVRTGRLERHVRGVDFREGVLDRELEWTSPSGRTVQVHSQRLVSLTRRGLLAVAYDVTPVDGPARVTLRSRTVAGGQRRGDDRSRRARELEQLEPEDFSSWDSGGCVVHRTRTSSIRIAVASEHLVEADVPVEVASSAEQNRAELTVSADLEAGQWLRLVKLVAYASSATIDAARLESEVRKELDAGCAGGWEVVRDEQARYLAGFWEQADVVVEGDPELQRAVRFALFHVLQSAARAEGHGIPAKGLTGTGYGGHVFWEAETYVLRVLTHTLPDAAADALRWRHDTLPEALERARRLRLEGAAFPWRTITGHESSGYWPAGTAEFHINGGIADAVLRHLAATGDEDLARSVGLDLLVHTARLWRSLGHHAPDGGFRIDGVTGPDEYSAVADNNTYTNLMAQRNLRAAADLSERHPERAAELGVDDAERASWRQAADAVVVRRDVRLGVTEQSEGFLQHEVWDFPGTSPHEYPLDDHFPYFQLYRKQVVKQADLVLALHLRGDAFPLEQKRRDFEYYEGITVRDSSLSPGIQAAVAAEVGHLDVALAYARESAFVDLHDLRRSAHEGLHIASLAGCWIALVAGFGGLCDGGDDLSFAPRLPGALQRLRFGIVRRAARLSVDVRPGEATYRLHAGGPLRLHHHGRPLDLTAERPVATLGIPPLPALAPPTPPAHRAPGHADLRGGDGGDDGTEERQPSA